MNTNPKNRARFTFLVEKVARHIIKSYRCFLRVSLIPKNMLNNHIMCRWRLDHTGEASKIHFWKIFARLSYHPFGIWGFRYHLHFVQGNLSSRCLHKKKRSGLIFTVERFAIRIIKSFCCILWISLILRNMFDTYNMWLWRLDHNGESSKMIFWKIFKTFFIDNFQRFSKSILKIFGDP